MRADKTKVNAISTEVTLGQVDVHDLLSAIMVLSNFGVDSQTQVEGVQTFPGNSKKIFNWVKPCYCYQLPESIWQSCLWESNL